MSALLFALSALPVQAQEAEGAGRGSETCAEVSLDGDFHLKIPCPPGARDLLKQLPRPAEPAPRRGIVIDPEWPHDQAMIAEHEWPHGGAMIAPQADAEEETVPLFGELLNQFEPYLSLDPEEGAWGALQSGAEFGETAE